MTCRLEVIRIHVAWWLLDIIQSVVCNYSDSGVMDRQVCPEERQRQSTGISALGQFCSLAQGPYHQAEGVPFIHANHTSALLM